MKTLIPKNFFKHPFNFFNSPSIFDKDFFDVDFDTDFKFDFPKIDVQEDGKKIVVKADLPDLDKKDVKLTVNNDLLTISWFKEEEKEEKKKKYYLKERSSNEVYRQVKLPHNVSEKKIKAKMKNWVLTINLEKAKLSKWSEIVIE